MKPPPNLPRGVVWNENVNPTEVTLSSFQILRNELIRADLYTWGRAANMWLAFATRRRDGRQVYVMVWSPDAENALFYFGHFRADAPPGPCIRKIIEKNAAQIILLGNALGGPPDTARRGP